ncbi:WD repeat-containing protein 43-like [Dysidea avara]
MVMLSDEGSLYVCQWTINESTKSDKPLLPSHHITMATEDSVPNPIPIWAVQLVSSENLICCYGYHVKPIIEKITIPAGQKEVCLFRKVTMDTGKKTGKPRKSLQSNQDTVTQLGPSNMVETLPLMSRDPKLQSHDPSQQGGSVSSKRQREIPTAQSLSNMLIQAIHSDDKKLMNTVLMTAKESSISETVQRLPTSSIVPFLQQLQVLVDTQPQLLERLLPWIHAVMVTHMSYLSTVPDVIGSLSVLRHLLDLRVNLFDKLCKLHGKLDLILTQAGSQDVTHQDIEPYTEVTMGMDDDNDDVSDDDLSSHDSDEASHDLSLSSDES